MSEVFMRWHSLLEQYSFNVLWNWHTQNIREHQILAPIFIYFENIFKKNHPILGEKSRFIKNCLYLCFGLSI